MHQKAVKNIPETMKDCRLEVLDESARNWIFVRLRFWATTCASLFSILIAAAWFTGSTTLFSFIKGSGVLLLIQSGVALGSWPAACLWALRLGKPQGGGIANASKSANHSRDWAALLIMLFLALLFMLGWTLLLARLVPHRSIAHLPQGFDRQGSTWAGLAFVFALLTLAPIVEEIFFRHYLLHRIAWAWRNYKMGPLISILITSIVFGLAHYGSLDPFWLKFIQSAGLGLILGAIAWNYGVEASMMLHWIFNLMLIPLHDWLH